MSPYEIIMLLCFGSAWPFSIYKSWHTKKTAGKSILFLIIVFLGYIAGIINKLLYHFDAVIYFYILNASMVLTDSILWFRNRTIEKQAITNDVQ